MQTKHLPSGALASGLFLILLGAISWMATFGAFELSWGNIWPAIMMAASAFPFTTALMVEQRQRAWHVFFGATLLLLGIFFFATTLGYAEWADQQNLWPCYLLIVGIAALAAYLASGLSHTAYLVSGLVTLVLGGAFLALTLSGTWYNFQNWVAWDSINWQWANNWWPIVPMAIGAFLILLSTLPQSRGGRAGLVLGGTIPLLLGIFFLITTLGVFTWEMQGKLWPTYPLVVGVAFLMAYLVSGFEIKPFLWVGIGLSVVALVFYGEMFSGTSVFDRLWPLILIVVGVILLFPTIRRPQKQ